MSRRRHRLVPILAMPLIVLAAATPAMAVSAAPGPAAPGPAAPGPAAPGPAAPAAAKTAEAGFVHFDAASGPTTTYSSNGQLVSILRDNPGIEVVNFPGLLKVRNAHVSLSGTGTDNRSSCSVESLTAIPVRNPTTLSAEVDCFDGGGRFADEPFDLLVTGPVSKPAGALDFAFVTVPNAAIGAQYNSAGKRNSVVRAAAGVYNVTMPGSGSAGNDKGTVKVSLASDQPGMCQIGSWTATKTAQKINVRCFDPAGTPTDQEFFVTYARGNNLMGQNGLTTANAKVQAVGRAPVYQPATQFDSKHGARITVAHLDRGSYKVFFAGSSPTGKPNGGDGNIQITPIGAGYRRCIYNLLRTHTPQLEVVCADANGTRRDTAFTVQWVVAGS